ncbi:DUF4377 domain-containing protein [Deinococcus sp. HMF7604]|uniref:DUF4377 domain-containing protein n=1 Tax=Deinococcus betulae TaxID=2873312 RepID=UPI001CCF4333|nr:DUF4377 domain-containing protein [Deinococcus betulae]MBZ9750934.1 DUF4377 domain-containing protein [Deinococcus betulae]
MRPVLLPLIAALALTACAQQGTTIELRQAAGACEASTSCLEYRQPENGSWVTLNNEIQGFTFEPGHRYVLSVKDEAKERPPCSPPEWRLLGVKEKTPTEPVVADATTPTRPC